MNKFSVYLFVFIFSHEIVLLCCSWALVKDEEVAKKMTKFIELSSIGVSKDSQLRAAKILQAVSDSCEHGGESRSFFEVSYQNIAGRWKKLREAVKESGILSTPEFPSAFCQYKNQTFSTQPGRFIISFTIPEIFLIRSLHHVASGYTTPET